MPPLLSLVLTALIAVSNCAFAEVTRIEVTKRQPFADGRAYGTAGAYERVGGRFHGEIDPKDPVTAGITDIDKAPVNARGKVEYSADFDILKPVDLSRGNGTMLYDVVNRGSKLALALFNDAPQSDDPASLGDGGNGFLMRYGFTIAWSGWEAGLREAAHRLHIEVPAARGLEQIVWDEILFNRRGRTGARLSFLSVDADKARSILYVLENHRTAPRALPATAWEYIDAQRIRLLPAGTAFPIGVIHQFTYPARNPPIAGLGFAATRDFVSFLRHETGGRNPLAAGGRPGLRVAIAHGNSQGGRYLRSFLHGGFNDDEAGRIVFDGMNPHLAAARIFLNHRFAQPARAFNLAYGFRGYGEVGFPFAYGLQPDPHAAREDGLLAACAARGRCPKIMHTVTSSEYWQSGSSLVTTDPLGVRDVPPPANVRIYHFAGAQHSVEAIMPDGVCAAPANTEVDPRPVMRALLHALDAWIKTGNPPPPSSYPRLARGTLIDAGAYRFPAIPGLVLPRGPNPRERFDYGPEHGDGVPGNGLPRLVAGRYAVRVPAVDRDGNETGGIRVPELAVPLGTATGWATRAPDAGGAGELCYLDGSYVPFARTRAQRLANGDPRRAVEERYLGKADYVARIQRAAARLQKSGYLLEEDTVRTLARAESRPW